MAFNRAMTRRGGWSREAPGTAAWAPLSLRRNFSWTLVGNVLYTGCQVAMLSVLARIGGPLMVGLFALGLAMTEPVILFANLSLRSVLATDAKELFDFADYLGLRLATTALALAVIAAFAIISNYRGEALAVIVAIGVFKACDAISDVCYGLLQQRERMDRIATSMMVKGMLGLGAFAGAVLLTRSLLWGVAALIVARLLTLLVIDVRNVNRVMHRDVNSLAGARGHAWFARVHPRWDRRTLLALARISFPLGVVILLVSLSTNIPRYVLAHSAGPAALGIYATMVYFLVAGDTLARALGQPASPRLASYHAAGNVAGFRGLLGRLLLIGTAIGVSSILVAAVIGEPVLRLLFGPEFAAQAGLLLLVMISGAVMIIGDSLGVALTAMRRFTVQIWVYLVAIVALGGASVVLVPVAGVAGAAWAALLGAVVVVIGFAGILATELRAMVAEPVAGVVIDPLTTDSAMPPATTPRPMRITFLVRSLGYGGAERQLSALARGLHARGHRVVVAVFYGGPFERELRDAGVPIRNLGKRGRWDVLPFLLRLVRFLREERPEVLHGYLDTANLLALGARLVVPVKAVAGIEASDPDLSYGDWLAHLHFRAERRLIHSFDLVVSNSHAGLGYFGPGQMPLDRTVVIPNGIDTNRFHPDPEGRQRVRRELGIDDQTKLIGMVARLYPMKDHGNFLHCAALVAEDRDDVRFICVGAGPAETLQTLQTLADDLGLGERLIWAGARSDMPAVYNALDVAVLSSRIGEGNPNVVGEAMACGVPCVATDVGDAAWVVGDKRRIAPPRDPAALRDAVLGVLDDIDRGAIDAEAIRGRIVAGFSLPVLIDNSERAFLQALGDGDLV